MPRNAHHGLPAIAMQEELAQREDAYRAEQARQKREAKKRAEEAERMYAVAGGQSGCLSGKQGHAGLPMAGLAAAGGGGVLGCQLRWHGIGCGF
jgi:hypothetical protein